MHGLNNIEYEKKFIHRSLTPKAKLKCYWMALTLLNGSNWKKKLIP